MDGSSSAHAFSRINGSEVSAVTSCVTQLVPYENDARIAEKVTKCFAS